MMSHVSYIKLLGLSASGEEREKKIWFLVTNFYYYIWVTFSNLISQSHVPQLNPPILNQVAEPFRLCSRFDLDLLKQSSFKEHRDELLGTTDTLA